MNQSALDTAVPHRRSATESGAQGGDGRHAAAGDNPASHRLHPGSFGRGESIAVSDAIVR
jgi:hypothetical protein